jgi:hypothetical protein
VVREGSGGIRFVELVSVEIQASLSIISRKTKFADASMLSAGITSSEAPCE